MPEPTFVWVDIDLLTPNTYNPNVMDPEMFAKAIESIHKFGFVDPVTVREVGDLFEIVDGEHRWKAAKEHSGACVRVKKRYVEHIGMRQLPITNLGVVSDQIAQQLTIVLNETRGEYEPKLMGALLVKLVAAEPVPALLELLPFTPARFEELAELPRVDWGSIAPKTSKPSRSEKWVERVYRLPVTAAKKLDEAIKEARADGSSDWQALQTLAERFLDS